MDSLSGKSTFRVYTKADTNCSLSIRNGQVILARVDHSDPFQHWVRDERSSLDFEDEEGFPSFALVNKATGQVMKHSVGAGHPVQLIPYVPDELDESVLWTFGRDVGDGYSPMRMVNNIRLNVDAFHDGSIHDGTIIGLWECGEGENQLWKMVPQQEVPKHKMVPPQHVPKQKTIPPQDVPKHRTVPPHNVPKHQVWDRLKMPSFRVYTKAETNCSLAIRNGKVVLARANLCDPSQHWVKDEKYGIEVKDEYGFPSFALVNKATGQAMKSVGAGHHVELYPYVPDIKDKSVLWTLASDLGDGYRAMRMVSNTLLNVDAFHDGSIHDGTFIGLWEWLQGENQQWKVVPHLDVPRFHVLDRLSRMPSVRVYTKAETNCSLSIRDGKVILARTDRSDPSQQWVKDEKHGTEVKDEYGFPSFSLVNKATGQAMKSVGAGHHVNLIPYVPDILDKSILWTLATDLGGGYRAMRMVNNTRVNVDAFHDGSIHDGTFIGLWEWTEGDNQQWKIVHY